MSKKVKMILKDGIPTANGNVYSKEALKQISNGGGIGHIEVELDEENTKILENIEESNIQGFSISHKGDIIALNSEIDN